MACAGLCSGRWSCCCVYIDSAKASQSLHRFIKRMCSCATTKISHPCWHCRQQTCSMPFCAEHSLVAGERQHLGSHLLSFAALRTVQLAHMSIPIPIPIPISTFSKHRVRQAGDAGLLPHLRAGGVPCICLRVDALWRYHAVAAVWAPCPQHADRKAAVRFC